MSHNEQLNFCAKCGNKLESAKAFCPSCGASPTVAPSVPTSIQGAFSKKIALVIAIAVVCTALIVGVAISVIRSNDEERLAGRWVAHFGYEETTRLDNSFEFTRNNRFVRTQYNVGIMFRAIPESTPKNEVVSYSGTGTVIFRQTCRGTFSIYDNRIEFACSDDDCRILVLSFSRTENTIDIGGHRFTRE
jgi:hypothetical protein